ncbi:M10 family metallopeptidase C-terminal domain-containing protein [Microvirga sp. BT350]|uniref:M10 family metallopeptidase C-terminal domain-containing protein n=2 Tax=Microvirga alba TaxID=2791025 RepID=A0A931BL63_9HYPH|nr:M10 family metallopeptidase C-terminal domain-containing protein [Microvirga alba]
MSYNAGWNQAPRSSAYGEQGGLGALDIAALQALYGVNTATALGDDVYDLPSQNTVGTGWTSIWDAGGIDTISGVSARNGVIINLQAASLVEGDPAAGGYASRQWDVGGGYTIAHGVTIENAYGGPSDDLLTGNGADNLLVGYGGDDVLRGLAGNDILKGGSGDDRLFGNDGDDTLIGGSGSDVLVGGPGRDVFVFASKPSARSPRDKIADFNVRDDTIHLENGIFKALKVGKLAKSAFWVGQQAHDAGDRIIYDNKKGVLYYDADGRGESMAVTVTVLTKGLKLTAADFFVI